MRLFIYLFLFLSFSAQLFSEEITVGKSYENQIHNFKNKKINIPLPPGKWEVTESNKGDINWKLWWKATLVNSENRGELYLAIPYVQSGMDTWAGGDMERCSEWITKDAVRIFAEGAKRSNPQRTYCISETDDSWLHLNFEARTMSTPIKWLYYDLYYPMRNIDKEIVNDKNIIKSLGKTGMDGVASGLQGNSSTFNTFEFDSLIKNISSDTSSSIDSSSVTSSLSDKMEKTIYVDENQFDEVCAILDCERRSDSGSDRFQDYIYNFLKDGKSGIFDWPHLAVGASDMLYGSPAWSMKNNPKKAIDSCEDYNDGKKCELIISNGVIVSDKFYKELIAQGFVVESNSENPDKEESDENDNDMSIDVKLKKLKSMFDEGLISQEQYDEKSSKILDDF